ncbi:PAP2 superfamily protein [Streptomyces sp. DvalAA-14]|uniref:phosphatase PAP2 family protein n=1 Tax=unclassified Streptomyces TaxID=2593676 RepID=UPI00081B5375|nr:MULTISPECIES: phosphatase PAP2 family protein [unclassified Streptomyces]MYS23067.1 phosphatase PAP2 family protein [Streptomyces sp. SID4948]SCE26770.1 PAP2 superfamily protein [Streptomyces sp. DvalAA-14]
MITRRLPRPSVSGPLLPADPSAPAPGARRSFALLVTDVLAPAPVLVVLLLVVGWHSGRVAGVAWAVAAATVSVGIPLAVVIGGVRAGRFTDIHVRVRRQRALPLAVAIACAVLCVVLLGPLGAPRELVVLVATIMAGLATGAAITVWWKVSGHTAVTGAATVILVADYGPRLLLVLVPACLVVWSRIVLRDHTPAQTVVGFLVGAAVSCVLFVPLHH